MVAIAWGRHQCAVQSVPNITMFSARIGYRPIPVTAVHERCNGADPQARRSTSESLGSPNAELR
jgi:hypothetical protein